MIMTKKISNSIVYSLFKANSKNSRRMFVCWMLSWLFVLSNLDSSTLAMAKTPVGSQDYAKLQPGPRIPLHVKLVYPLAELDLGW